MLASGYVPGMVENGYQAHISGVSRELAKHPDINLTVVSSGDSYRDEVAEGYRYRMMKRHSALGRIPLLQTVNLLRIINESQADIIHLQGSAFGLQWICAFAPRIRETRRVVTIHGHPVEEGIVNGLFRPRSILHMLYRLAERTLVTRFNHVVCVTERRRDELLEKYGARIRAMISVIPNGVDQSLLESTTQNQGHSMHEPGSRPLRILCAKSLVPYNGQEYLLQAFRMVLDAVPDARLTLAGDGWQRMELESIASNLGLSDNVDFLGWVPNHRLHEILANSTVSITCSVPLHGVEEGSSISILEAMALGVPVIATWVGGSREVVRDKATGILIPPADPAAIRDAILSLWNDADYSANIAQAGKAFVWEHRTWKTIADIYHDIYMPLSLAPRGNRDVR
jgi:glycosyltransferase involved in cell wall biosynthesis